MICGQICLVKKTYLAVNRLLIKNDLAALKKFSTILNIGFPTPFPQHSLFSPVPPFDKSNDRRLTTKKIPINVGLWFDRKAGFVYVSTLFTLFPLLYSLITTISYQIWPYIDY